MQNTLLAVRAVKFKIMKVKLLKRLRSQSRDEVHINSVTTSGGTVTGMSIGYDDNCYEGIFDFGNTEEDVMRKVFHIFFSNRAEKIREKYKKYSVRNSRV